MNFKSAYLITVSILFSIGCSYEQSTEKETKADHEISVQNFDAVYSQSLDDYLKLEIEDLNKYAANNDVLAQTQLALNVLMGLKGHPINQTEGMALLEKAALQGRPEAIYYLSEMYITPSISGIEDREKSKILLRQAAEANYGLAQMMLANRLQFGAYEHTRNIEEAKMWYERALTNGEEGAQFGLDNLNRLNN